MIARLILYGVLAMVAACAHVPGPGSVDQVGESAQNWQVAGRFAAGQIALVGGVENEPLAGRFAWRHETTGDVLWLIGPLGNTLARVDMTPSGVRWQDAAGKRGEAKSLGSLGESLAGIFLPEEPAERWLRARWPANDVGQRDASARVLKASARGWDFVYRYGAPAPEGWPLALEASGPDGLWLRLALTEWNGAIDPAETPTP